MKTIILLAVAATAFTGATSAHANAVAPRKSPYRATYDSKRDQYCLIDKAFPVYTGTRIQTPECRSAAEWAQRGLKVQHKRSSKPTIA